MVLPDWSNVPQHCGQSGRCLARLTGTPLCSAAVRCAAGPGVSRCPVLSSRAAGAGGAARSVTRPDDRSGGVCTSGRVPPLMPTGQRSGGRPGLCGVGRPLLPRRYVTGRARVPHHKWAMSTAVGGGARHVTLATVPNTGLFSIPGVAIDCR